jgi:hypothetical protein
MLNKSLRSSLVFAAIGLFSGADLGLAYAADSLDEEAAAKTVSSEACAACKTSFHDDIAACGITYTSDKHKCKIKLYTPGGKSCQKAAENKHSLCLKTARKDFRNCKTENLCR